MRFVSRVDVECCDLKPCCEGDNLMCGVMLFRTSLSSISEGLQKEGYGSVRDWFCGGFVGLQNGYDFG